MFVKNDNEFVCQNCGKKVEKLVYTSRDHCNYCLHSIHIDITPGDRENTCLGDLVPVNVIETSKKGKVIVYKCSKCKATIKNVASNDDSLEKIYEVIKKYSMGNGDI